MKRILSYLVLGLFILLAILVFNGYRKPSKQLTGVVAVSNINLSDSVVNHLAEAIRFRTVSYSDVSLMDSTQFEKFIGFLTRTYPLVHSKLSHERVGGFSLLFKWEGTDKSLKPALLMGHYDVVPVIQGTEKMWKNMPFAGEVSGDFIYGRGTLDDKSTVIGVLEAVEYLLRQNYKPKRTFYLAFGHDEEISGLNGAKTIANLLQSRNIGLEYGMDEGGTIKADGLSGISRPIALVGISEKGYTSIKMTATGEGGHSSMPPAQTSIGILAEAIDKLQKHPFPASIQGATSSMFDYLAPEMSFGQRLVLSNRWLLEPLIIKSLQSSPSGNATLRTTISPTIFNAGIKDNVLPIEASAVINFRIMPNDSVQGVVDYVKKVIENEKITVESLKQFDTNPSPISDTASVGFRQIHHTIKKCFPDVIVAPYLVVGATDARHYRSICANLFRFMPVRLTDEDLKRPHGTNERISTKDFKKIIQFYTELIKNE